VMFNIESLEISKESICKKNVELSLCEETSLARNLSSNRCLHFTCTNSSSVISI
jgi:hypothetical protein